MLAWGIALAGVCAAIWLGRYVTRERRAWQEEFARLQQLDKPRWTYKPGLDAPYDFSKAVAARKRATSRDAAKQRLEASRVPKVAPFKRKADVYVMPVRNREGA